MGARAARTRDGAVRAAGGAPTLQLPREAVSRGSAGQADLLGLVLVQTAGV